MKHFTFEFSVIEGTRHEEFRNIYNNKKLTYSSGRFPSFFFSLVRKKELTPVSNTSLNSKVKVERVSMKVIGVRVVAT